MVTRMDHVVVLVHDLAAATDQYRRIGFVTDPGGQHVGFGTENSLVRFDLDYLELLSLRDPDEARRGRYGGETFVRTAASGDGLISYVLATDVLEGDIARVRAAGVECSEPFPMQRRRPDGRVLEWRLAFPGGPPWGQPLPYLIQWDTPESVRLPAAPPAHPNGALGIARVVVRAVDPERTTAAYAALLDRPGATGPFTLGPLTIAIEAAPNGREGIAEVDLAVRDLDVAAAVLERAGALGARSAGRVAIDPAAACGARFTLVAG